MAQQVYKLTQADRNYLNEIGFKGMDFDLIEKGFNEVKLTLTTYDLAEYVFPWLGRPVQQECDQEKAIEVLGREEFLSGLLRSVYHLGTSRSSEDHKYEVEFSLYHWWEQRVKEESEKILKGL